MNFAQIKTHMQENLAKTDASLKKEFMGLRTGRATTSLLDTVMVEAYGAVVPLNQVANVNVAEARMLSVQVWDRGLIKNVEKGILEAGLGLNPMNDGSTIRIPIPPLSEERRIELTKVAGRFTETARVSVRNVRREALDEVKKLKAANEISEDDQKRFEMEIQTMTDNAIKALDEHLKHKEAEIKQV
ncbi:MAG: ribosome recycling factor [Lactobacillales bacterium]|jgi:ribosome recycling factor|nr:ribosome recycling factor [Lactobacillales bacterium]